MKSSNHNPVRRKCDIVLDNEGWRIEYTQQGVRVRHRLSAKDKNAAVKEATAQGFTLIRIYRESTPGHLFSEGKVVARQAEEEDEEE